MIFQASDSSYAVLQELRAAREIAHAFLNAEQPIEVYRTALERVSPIVGAAFGCVFLRVPGDDDVLHVVTAHNWPDAFADYIDSVRVRVGAGPTGRAVASGEMVEVPDVFANDELRDWWDPARELGFRSTVSAPLRAGGPVIGALTFYFEREGDLADAERALLRLVADQLAATVEKAELIEDLRAANQRLREQYVEIEARYRQAEEAKRLKTEFLSNVSHELRTPLNAILGYTFLLRESEPDWADGGAELEKIEQSASSLLTLINELLDLTRLKLDRVHVARERCDAVALARAAFEGIEHAGERLQLSLDTPGEPIPVNTDPSHVIRILSLLLSNAVKFTDSGSVRLGVRGGDDAVVWEVEDTGMGIDPEFHEAIFDEFRQVDGSLTREHGGLGMGLALARHLTRRLGGDLTVESAAEGGATFRLRLPVEPRPMREEADVEARDE